MLCSILFCSVPFCLILLYIFCCFILHLRQSLWRYGASKRPPLTTLWSRLVWVGLVLLWNSIGFTNILCSQIHTTNFLRFGSSYFFVFACVCRFLEQKLLHKYCLICKFVFVSFVNAQFVVVRPSLETCEILVQYFSNRGTWLHLKGSI